MLDEHQKFLQAQIQAAKTNVKVAQENYTRLKQVCTHVYAQKYDSAVCVICENHAGWWCPDGPNNTCEYDHDEWCIHCGDPEERK